MIASVTAFTTIVGLGLVMFVLGAMGLAHGYIVMGHRWSGEQRASLTGRVYGGTWSRSLMRLYLAVIAAGVAVAAVGSLGLLVVWLT
jgi:hypothetical protein